MQLETIKNSLKNFIDQSVDNETKQKLILVSNCLVDSFWKYQSIIKDIVISGSFLENKTLKYTDLDLMFIFDDVPTNQYKLVINKIAEEWNNSNKDFRKPIVDLVFYNSSPLIEAISVYYPYHIYYLKNSVSLINNNHYKNIANYKYSLVDFFSPQLLYKLIEINVRPFERIDNKANFYSIYSKSVASIQLYLIQLGYYPNPPHLLYKQIEILPLEDSQKEFLISSLEYLLEQKIVFMNYSFYQDTFPREIYEQKCTLGKEVINLVSQQMEKFRASEKVG